jgi:hypothetical protein
MKSCMISYCLQDIIYDIIHTYDIIYNVIVLDSAVLNPMLVEDDCDIISIYQVLTQYIPGIYLSCDNINMVYTMYISRYP